MTVASHNAWLRVSPRVPCPICGHDSWCIIAPDGNLVRCKRERSSKPASGSDGEAWYHRLAGCRLPEDPPNTISVPSRIDFGEQMSEWQHELGPRRLATFADKMHVSPESLRMLGIGWDGRRRSFAFPMYDSKRRVVGVRLRCARTGRNYAQRGSTAGVFLPTGIDQRDPVCVTEGVSDAAAALDLGLEVIGRPGATGAVHQIGQLVHARKVVVFGDNDDVGRSSADALVSAIVCRTLGVRVVFPPDPHKDLRDWVTAGATYVDVRRAIIDSTLRKLETRIQRGGVDG